MTIGQMSRRRALGRVHYAPGREDKLERPPQCILVEEGFPRMFGVDAVTRFPAKCACHAMTQIMPSLHP
eukprot:2074500-Amphidinium_carterae.1